MHTVHVPYFVEMKIIYLLLYLQSIWYLRMKCLYLDRNSLYLDHDIHVLRQRPDPSQLQ